MPMNHGAIANSRPARCQTLGWAILLAGIGLTFNLHAQWVGDPAVNTPIVDVGYHDVPRLAQTSTGETYVCWYGRLIESHTPSLYLSLLSTDGTPIWPEPIAIDGGSSIDSVGLPTLLVDDQDRCIVVVRKAGVAVVAHAFQADAGVDWSLSGVLLSDPLDLVANRHVWATALDDGSIIAVWIQGHLNLRARRLGLDGTPIGPVQDLEATPGAQLPIVVPSAEGSFIVAWHEFGDDSVKARRYSLTGVPLWTAPLEISGGGPSEPRTSSEGGHADRFMVPDGSGGAVFGWSESRLGNGQPFVQHVQADGVLSFAPGGLSLNEAPELGAYAPAIHFDPSDEKITAVWSEVGIAGPFANQRSLRAQRISLDGEFEWGPESVSVRPFENTQVRSYQLDRHGDRTRVAYVDQMTWWGPGYVEVVDIDATGSLLPPSAITISSQFTDKNNLELITNPSGSSVLAWSESRPQPGGSARIVYAQNLTAGAELGFPTEFIRGDLNGDSAVEVSDVVIALNELFVDPTFGEPCQKARDINDDSVVDIADPIYLLRHLFLADTPPPTPFLSCGVDTTYDELTCVLTSSCP